MAFLKPALHILDLVERAEYKDALEFIDSSSQNPHIISSVAVDLIYKVGHCFGNEDNSYLKKLLDSLLKFLDVSAKFRICWDLLTNRNSHSLTDSLLKCLSREIDAGFSVSHPEFWRKLCDELPQRLERRICERIMCDDEELQHPIEEAAYVMIFFDSIEPRVDYKFSKLLKAVLDEIDPSDRAAFPFLTRLARMQPFSPTLVQHRDPVVLIPCVYDCEYLSKRLVDALNHYLIEKDYSTENAYIKPITNALGFIAVLRKNLNRSDIMSYAELISLLLRCIEDFSLERTRLHIMKLCEEFIEMFDETSKALILKLIIYKIVTVRGLELNAEAQLIAWLLDIFKIHLNLTVFRMELGNLYGMLEDVRYEDMPAASAYYSAVLLLVQSQALMRFNVPMLTEVRERIVERIYRQLTDFLHLQEMRVKDEKEPKKRGRSNEKGKDAVSMILFNCERAKSTIESCLSSRN